MAPRREFLLYLDDSGSRDPDRNPKTQAHVPDWFALGGILVDKGVKDEIEDRVDAFRQQWPLLKPDTPLRSYNIRNRGDGFRWLDELDEGNRRRFYDELTNLMTSLPVVVAGCVVHRPGYNARYMTEYGPRRWKLCKTAFNIAVERAAKYALHHEGRLRVLIERSDRETEQHMKAYYEELRSQGAPFNATTSSQYAPLDCASLKQALLEFGIRTKGSTLMQLADLMLWPICKAPYNPAERAYLALKDNGLLLDGHCNEANRLLGIKYSCFDPP